MYLIVFYARTPLVFSILGGTVAADDEGDEDDEDEEIPVGYKTVFTRSLEPCLARHRDNRFLSLA